MQQSKEEYDATEHSKFSISPIKPAIESLVRILRYVGKKKFDDIVEQMINIHEYYITKERYISQRDTESSCKRAQNRVEELKMYIPDNDSHPYVIEHFLLMIKETIWHIETYAYLIQDQHKHNF